MGLNLSSDHSEVGHSKVECSKVGHSKVGCSEASCLVLEAERASPVPSREASGDCSEVASDGEIQDQGCFDS